MPWRWICYSMLLILLRIYSRFFLLLVGSVQHTKHLYGNWELWCEVKMDVAVKSWLTHWECSLWFETYLLLKWIARPAKRCDSSSTNTYNVATWHEQLHNPKLLRHNTCLGRLDKCLYFIIEHVCTSAIEKRHACEKRPQFSSVTNT